MHTMNDTKPLKHGEEGTHSVCNKHNIGDKSVCCECSGKDNCGDEPMTYADKRLEEFEKGAVGKNVHSVYVHCNSCYSWGVNLPLEKECGNCGNTEDAFTYYDAETITLLINQAIAEERERVITEDTSDGFHTFKELYEHRITLYIALCRQWEPDISVWRSTLHSDGSSFEGWFILGIDKRKGEQITYHLPNGKWDDTSFAETLEKAPEFDGHTSADVLKRISNL